MIIIKEVLPPCTCRDKLATLQAAFNLWTGSIVECDCGQQYILTDDQRDGLTWLTYSPDPRLA